MNGFDKDEFGNNGEMPAQNEDKNGSMSGVISWGDREYEVDEFRSLLMAKPEDNPGEYRDGT